MSDMSSSSATSSLLFFSPIDGRNSYGGFSVVVSPTCIRTAPALGSQTSVGVYRGTGERNQGGEVRYDSGYEVFRCFAETVTLFRPGDVFAVILIPDREMKMTAIARLVVKGFWSGGKEKIVIGGDTAQGLF